MTIEEMVEEAWAIAEKKGFHEGYEPGDGRMVTMLRLCLIHTEVSEAAQLVKRKWPMNTRVWDDGLKYECLNEFSEELADILIRVGDLAKCSGISGQELSWAVAKKMAKNMQRPHKYGTSESEKAENPANPI